MIEQHYGILFVLGASAFVGLLGAWLFQKIKCPQVVGYIVVGLILGQSGIGLIDETHITSLEPFTFFALGMIGFLVGGELKITEFKKYGKQFMTILLGEGLTAFFLVGLGTGGLIYALNGVVANAVAGGVVLGAIASATDPASTIDVLWEYRGKGIVTTALVAIIALDDALAMTLYSIGKAVSGLLTGKGGSLGDELLGMTKELGGAILVAAIASYVLRYILMRTHNKDKALAISISTLFLVIGLSVTLHMDVILASMTLGFGISNLLPKRSDELFHTARSMSIPIYVLFFVLVGARFNVMAIPGLVWGIAGIYVVARSVGKFAGTWFGAGICKADMNIKKYAGLGLFAQGGVAIGLAIVASHNLEGIQLTNELNLGQCVIAVVTATTIAVQLVGPLMTKLAIKLSGEIGRSITDEDVMASMTIKDILLPDTEPLTESSSVDSIIESFASSQQTVKAVHGQDGKLSGVISFSSLREALPDRDMWQWLVASDIMTTSYTDESDDAQVLNIMNTLNVTNQDFLVVTSEKNPEEIVGVVDRNYAKNVIKQNLIQKLA